jgi:hypothetical protein
MVVVAAQQQHCRGKQCKDGVCCALLAEAEQGGIGRVSEAARQWHGDGGHRGGGGGSAREVAGAGGGGGSLAAAWRAERRQRGSVGSFLSAGQWEWKHGGGGSSVGSALALVAARPQSGCSKQHCDGICSMVLAEAVQWQHQQSNRGSAAEAR